MPSMPELVCFSHLRWNFVYQRPQHLLSRAARDFRVHFFEEPTVADGVAPRLRVTESPEGVRVVVPMLPAGLDAADALALQGKLLRTFLADEQIAPDVAWYYTPMARAFTFDQDFPVVVYDCMDELSAFKGAPKGLGVMEQELLSASDVVFTGGQALYEAKRAHHRNIHAFPSSVDVQHFLPARNSSQPQCPLAHLRRPRLGYMGVIDERIDYDLIANLADLKPDWEIVMIGPAVKVDPAALPQRPNIHWLGSRPYADIPDYLRGLDIGLMPFAMNEATAYISPTKTPEYLAAGLRVISTPVTDVVRTWAGPQGVVEIVHDAPSAAAACVRCFEAASDSGWLARVDAMLAECSWDRTWRAMHQLILQSSRRAPVAVAAHV